MDRLDNEMIYIQDRIEHDDTGFIMVSITGQAWVI
jgi:hypothetical protein